MQSPKTRSEKIGKENGVKNNITSGSSANPDLRFKAEEILEKREILHLPDITRKISESDNLTDEEFRKLLYELEVHQVELEMQNEELVRAKKLLELSAEKYAELYDFSPSGYFTLNREGEILELNLFGAQLLGKERINLINSRFGFFVSPETRPLFNNFIESLFTINTKASCEIVLNHQNDEKPLTLLINGLATRGSEKCLIAATDISRLKYNEKELQLKQKELEKASSEKDNFFSIIAHDLISPFNGFLGLTELLAESVATMNMDDVQKIAGMMKNSATNLHHLLGNLLEWSRLHRGLIPCIPKRFMFRQNIFKYLGLVIDSAKAKQIELEFEIPEELEILADEFIIESVMRNLVANSVKFTPHGGKITVSANWQEDNTILVSVKDNGIGMDKEIIDSLFRLDGKSGRKGTDGELSTGLGLLICKDLIEKHNGQLKVESEAGKGSNFQFTIPEQRF